MLFRIPPRSACWRARGYHPMAPSRSTAKPSRPSRAPMLKSCRVCQRARANRLRGMAPPLPRSGVIDAASDMPTLLTYSRGQGGWIDLAHRAQRPELPVDILERYRVAERKPAPSACAGPGIRGWHHPVRCQALRPGQRPLSGTGGRPCRHRAEQPVWRVAGAP